MTVLRDWIKAAAEEIIQHGDDYTSEYPLAGDAEEIIRRHCPMKMDTAYMPVPRCEFCSHWESNASTVEERAEMVHGWCKQFMRYEREDFGCVEFEG